MPRTKRPRLITIPISHYCEKARWALDLAGIPFEEQAHLQVFHYPVVMLAGGGISVPALVTEEQTFGDSTDILKWIDRQAPDAGLYPAPIRKEVEQWEELFDEELGPASRRLAYFFLLNDPKEVMPYNCTGVPRWQARLFPYVLGFASRYLRWRLRVRREFVQSDLETVRRLFTRVEEVLTSGQRYLVGDRFTAADLTFASLAAPVLMPERYGVPLPPKEQQPAAMRPVVEEFRSSTAGQFALRLYAEHRGREPNRPLTV